MAYDATLYKETLEFKVANFKWKFTSGYETKDGKKNVLAAVCVHERITAVSEDAYQYIKQKWPHRVHDAEGYVTFAKSWGSDIRLEHPVPVEFYFQWLESDKKRLTDAFIRDFIENRCMIALITTDQDDILTDEGFKSAMPDGWDVEHGDLLLRYRKVGITMHQWENADK